MSFSSYDCAVREIYCFFVICDGKKKYLSWQKSNPLPINWLNFCFSINKIKGNVYYMDLHNKASVTLTLLIIMYKENEWRPVTAHNCLKSQCLPFHNGLHKCKIYFNCSYAMLKNNGTPLVCFSLFPLRATVAEITFMTTCGLFPQTRQRELSVLLF